MICNYKVFAYDNELLERFVLRNEKGKELSDDVTAIFIDLTKATDIAKKQAIEMSAIEKWVVFLAFGNNPLYTNLIEDILKLEEGIAVAYDTLNNISKDADERARYLSRKKFQQDQEHDHAVSRREGREEGLQLGREEKQIEIDALENELKAQREEREAEREAFRIEIITLKSQLEAKAED